MKNSKQHRRTGQSTMVSETTKKQDVNLQKNATIYFQIGLILCLLGSYALLEMRFSNKVITPPVLNPQDGLIEVALTEVKPQVIKKKRPEIRKPIPSHTFDTIQFIEADDPLPESVISDESSIEEPVVSIEDIKVVEVEDEPVNINSVQKVPVFPGCEKYSKREDLTKCMSDKIGKIVRRKFNTNIAGENGLSGKQRIWVEFTIGTNGEIDGIKTRAPHPQLETEAERVINKIPKMEPGYQGNKPVRVIYTLPIIFQVRD